jgi:hypothetical protein
MKKSVQKQIYRLRKVTVTTQVIGYKKRDIETNQILELSFRFTARKIRDQSNYSEFERSIRGRTSNQ